MSISEKWNEIEWALSAQPPSPLMFEKAPDCEPDVYQFIVTDNSSNPVTDFNSYAELE
ncbi:MAG: hypothetical protein JNK74_18675 [Candidatus Hydrogenedentes bacterium]|nr:hypothetical protein [Candidatus Hydrogenedentota bacterium]